MSTCLLKILDKKATMPTHPGDKGQSCIVLYHEQALGVVQNNFPNRLKQGTLPVSGDLTSLRACRVRF